MRAVNNRTRVRSSSALFFIFVALGLAGPAARSAAAGTIAAWDMSTGLPGGTNNFGPSPLAATTADPHVTVGGLTRGSGVGTSGSGAARAVSFDALRSVLTSSAPLTMGATASSGLPVAYASTNPAVATVSGNVVTIVAAGTTNIVASQDGNADVLPAASVSRPLTVAPTAPAVPAAPPPAVMLFALMLAAAAGTARSRPR